jgi:PadR family transcriptional regulator, regulatory protein PadR
MARSPMTPYALLVLRALAATPDREMYGLEIMRAASLPSGTVYPLLARLEAEEWLSSRAEGIVTQAEGRPARKYFRITPAGVAAVREATEREAVRLTALGVADGAPEATDPLKIGGIEIPLIVDDCQPPGIVSVVSAGLDRDGKAVVHAAHVNIGPDEAESVSEELCEHRIPPGSFCVRCGRLIGGLRLSYGLPARPPDSGAPRGTSARIQVDVGRKDPERRHRRGVLV